MINSVSAIIISILSALGTGFVSFIFTRAKYKSEVKSSDLANMAKQMEIYQKLHEDSMRNLDLKIQQNQSLDKQLDELREQNVEFKAQITNLTAQNQITQQQNKVLQEQVKTLQEQNEQLKEQNKQLQNQISEMSEQIKILQELVSRRIDDFLAEIK